MIILEKAAKVDLAKKNVGFPPVKVDFEVVADRSGSIKSEVNNGNYQNTTTRMAGIGYSCDRNKAVEFYAFNQRADYIGTMDEQNYENFVQDVFLKKVRIEGMTNYAPAMRLVLDSMKEGGKKRKGFLSGLFGRKLDEQKEEIVPKFVVFITDGKNDDWEEAEKVIRESSNMPVFWQFVGIGSDNRKDFPFLMHLDEMGGRTVDNANFFCVKDITKMSDEALYEKILTEFPTWYKVAKEKGIL